MTEELDRWLNTGDMDELLREVERCSAAGDWDRLLMVRDRSRAALDRGHQLWPVASFAEYRMALSAPPEQACAVIREGTGFLAPGPLTEVIAQQHRWDELEPHLGAGPLTALVAQERVIRGERLDTEPPGGELPGRLMPWEPGYAVAEYRPDAARFPAPDLAVPREAMAGGRMLHPAEDGALGARALEEVTRHWASHSEGRVRAVAVEGSAADAVTSLRTAENGIPGRIRWAQVSLADAAGLLAWSAASGGAMGRRRGMATGRFEVWWALAVITASEDRWPVDPGPEAEGLRFFVWTPEEPAGGWVCRLAVEDPDVGLSWALDASDQG